MSLGIPSAVLSQATYLPNIIIKPAPLPQSVNARAFQFSPPSKTSTLPISDCSCPAQMPAGTTSSKARPHPSPTHTLEARRPPAPTSCPPLPFTPSVPSPAPPHSQSKGKQRKATQWKAKRSQSFPLRAPEQKLHVLRRQFLHRDLVVVDGAVDHVRLLLLEQDHARLDRVLDAEARDDAGAFLADSMASGFWSWS